jgi:hypothetical protein
MAKRFQSLFDRMSHRRHLSRWSRAAGSAADMDITSLRTLRAQARQFRREIDRLMHVADGRLAVPVLGARAIQKPLHSDWAWRPPIWCGAISPPGMAAVQSRAEFGPGAAVFHDCSASELTIRQVRNIGGGDLAPYGFRMDVFAFDGSFLSLVIDLPPEAVQGLTLRHLIRLDTVVELENPIEIFARLNIKHGPNTDQVVRELPLHENDVFVEFDLAYTNMNEKRVERAWVDLIFEAPALNQIVLRDVTFSRRPRAEI